MLLIVLGIGFERVAFPERWRAVIGAALLLGAIVFPLGVLMQTWSHGPLPRAVAIVGSALLIGGLAITALGALIHRHPA